MENILWMRDSDRFSSLERKYRQHMLYQIRTYLFWCSYSDAPDSAKIRFWSKMSKTHFSGKIINFCRVATCTIHKSITENPIWPPEYDLPGNFIFSLLEGAMIVTPHHSDFYGWCMGNPTEINDFAWKVGFAHFDPGAYFSPVRGVSVGSTRELGEKLMHHMLTILRPGNVTKAFLDRSFLSMLAGAVLDSPL